MVTGISMRLEKQILKKFKQKLTSAFYPEKQPPGSCPGIFFFFTYLRVFGRAFSKPAKIVPKE